MLCLSSSWVILACRFSISGIINSTLSSFFWMLSSLLLQVVLVRCSPFRRPFENLVVLSTFFAGFHGLFPHFRLAIVVLFLHFTLAFLALRLFALVESENLHKGRRSTQSQSRDHHLSLPVPVPHNTFCCDRCDYMETRLTLRSQVTN